MAEVQVSNLNEKSKVVPDIAHNGSTGMDRRIMHPSMAEVGYRELVAKPRQKQR